MLTCSKCHETKDPDCFGRNRSKATGYNTYCKLCMAVYYRENRERIAARKREYNAENCVVVAEQKRAWRQQNATTVASYQKQYKAENRPAISRAINEWKRKHPHKVRGYARARYEKDTGRQHAHTAKRRAGQLHATPSWSDSNFVSGMYSICKLMNRVRGAGTYSVDHIVPLRSKLVCGLHAHTNLTIMRTIDNKAKNNRHWPDMP